MQDSNVRNTTNVDHDSQLLTRAEQPFVECGSQGCTLAARFEIGTAEIGDRHNAGSAGNDLGVTDLQ